MASHGNPVFRDWEERVRPYCFDPRLTTIGCHADAGMGTDRQESLGSILINMRTVLILGRPVLRLDCPEIEWVF